MKLSFILILILGCSNINAQNVQQVFSLQFENVQGIPKPVKLVYLTSDNADGYNGDFNRLNDSIWTFTHQLDGEKDSDIYQMNTYNLGKSPHFTTKATERDFEQIKGSLYYSLIVQRNESSGIYLYEKNPGKISLSPLTFAANIHDHLWINEDQCIYLNEIEDQFQIWVYNKKYDSERLLVERAGKTIKSLDEYSFHYIDIFSDSFRYIKSYDLTSGSTRIITIIPNDCDAFAMLNKSYFLMLDQHILMKFELNKDANWKPLLDLRKQGSNNMRSISSFDEHTILLFAD